MAFAPPEIAVGQVSASGSRLDGFGEKLNGPLVVTFGKRLGTKLIFQVLFRFAEFRRQCFYV